MWRRHTSFARCENRSASRTREDLRKQGHLGQERTFARVRERYYIPVKTTEIGICIFHIWWWRIDPLFKVAQGIPKWVDDRLEYQITRRPSVWNPDKGKLAGATQVHGKPERDTVMIKIHCDAWRNNLIASQKQKTHYDKHCSESSFKVGDSVWYYSPAKKKGVCPKLQLFWEGPYQIISQVNDVLFKIKRNSKILVVNQQKLKRDISRLPEPQVIKYSGSSVAEKTIDGKNYTPSLDEACTSQITNLCTRTRSGKKVKTPTWFGTPNL